jgi:uncharacterized LabA/DUF88 family protein
MSTSDPRIAMLVDTDNLYHAARRRLRGRVDYRQLRETVAQGRPVARALAYVLRAEDLDVSAFLDALRAADFELRTKVAWRTAEGQSRADWRVGLALEAAALAARVDVIALVTGDGGYADLGAFLRARGVRLEIHAIDGSISGALAESADEVFALGAEVLLS